MTSNRVSQKLYAEGVDERKCLEGELQDSQERFRAHVQLSFDVYWETDAEYRFTHYDFAPTLLDAPDPGSEIGKTRCEVRYIEPDEEAWSWHRATLAAHLPFRDFELARPTARGGIGHVLEPAGAGETVTISRAIVEAQGGRLWESTNEPRGAVFRLTLPVAAVEGHP